MKDYFEQFSYFFKIKTVRRLSFYEKNTCGPWSGFKDFEKNILSNIYFLFDILSLLVLTNKQTFIILTKCL
jgi:hypothetical protein